jgi:long-subunit acyl-CoA synthetase (AMP-forming)
MMDIIRMLLKKNIMFWTVLLVILGFVGQPLPDVNVRIVKDDIILLEGNNKNIKIINSVKHDINEEGYSGNLQIKGKNVFKEYWRKPESTKKEFTEDGWFKTGKSMYKHVVYPSNKLFCFFRRFSEIC